LVPLLELSFFLSVSFSPYWKTISKAGVWSSSTKKGFASLGNSLSVALPVCSFAKKWEVFVATFALSARDRKCIDLGFLQRENENLKVLN
jgi:hypothetical protein